MSVDYGVIGNDEFQPPPNALYKLIKLVVT